MPWHPCVNSRDSITQADGEPLSKYLVFGHSDHHVTSFCRDDNGTWVAWIHANLGDSLTHGDTNKADWPSRVLSAHAIGVGYFPDDGSAAITYELDINPCWTWVAGTYSSADHCSILPILGGKYANDQRSSLTSWAMRPFDVQVRTDGTNVWVVVLAQESVRYAYLTNGANDTDRCGVSHLTIVDEAATEGLTPGNDGDAFLHDTDTGRRWWQNFGKSDTSHDGGSGWNDDPGVNNSFRWQPARVTVFGGDIGGFTRIDTVEATFANGDPFGLCGGVETYASSAEPSVLHVMWSEAGTWDSYQAQIGQRLTYSRWGPASKDIEVELFYAVEGNSGGYNSDTNWCWTSEYALRNDSGSPAAIVCPWPDGGGPGPAEFWDLSGATANVLQTLDPSLYPTVAESGLSSQVAINGIFWTPTTVSGFTRPRRVQFASTLYTDPTLTDQDVYLVCVSFYDPTLDSTPGGEDAGVRAFYRIPVDGSATFDYMDGTRLPMYSIIPTGVLGADDGLSGFTSDFASDPGNVWMPTLESFDAGATFGGPVLHLPRTCTRTWELLPGFPVPDPSIGAETGAWGGMALNTSPPSLITDDAGDWLAGGGTGPQLTLTNADPTNIAALRAKICRCCVPCIERIGLHIWEKV